jgi:DNA-binding transcriptional LysR family regulator
MRFTSSSEKVADDHFVVVATSGKASRLKLPSDLARQTLLFDDHEDAWPRWFAARGMAHPVGIRYHQFTDSGLLVEAAARGQGVALARWSLIQDELRAGRLVVAFAKLPALEAFHGYFLVGLRETFRRPEIAAFRTWLLEELRGLVASS